MPHFTANPRNTRVVDSFGLTTNHIGGTSTSQEFYEIDQGVVLDIVIDDKHPIFTGGESVHSKIDPRRWPGDLEGKAAVSTDFDYTWIGRILVRPLITEKFTDKDQLLWAYPLDNCISDYPLINETVYLITQGGKLYYSRKLNYHNWPNNNLDFAIENATSGQTNNILFSNLELKGKKESLTNYKGDSGYHGYAGQYFVANNKIRTIKRWEGDLLVESRHGQTIHFTAYDKTRNNDVGQYADYKDGGNPMILIRNRQRPLLKVGQKLSLTNSPNLATISGTTQEKNVGGYLEENINHDGSSIHITSGQTISEWVTTCYKKMFGTGEEVAAFNGTTSFEYPTLNGDQIVIQSDRLIFSSRYGETFHYSKKRYAVVTDSEYTVDAHDQIVMTTHVKTVINSPAIYLGEYDQTNEPVLLGQTTVNLLYEMCNWMLAHTHWYSHSHVNAGQESPEQTQLSVQVAQLIMIRDRLQSCLSRRVFVTGGGLAPGQNGANISNGASPVSIMVGSGNGAPGGFNGQNHRL